MSSDVHPVALASNGVHLWHHSRAQMYLAPPSLFPARWKVIHRAEEWEPGNKARLYIVLLSCYMQTIALLLLGDFSVACM